MPAASNATLSTRPRRTRARRWARWSVAAPGGGVGVIWSLLVAVVMGSPAAGGEALGTGGSTRAPFCRQASAVHAALPALVVIRLTLGLDAPAPPKLGLLKAGVRMPEAVVSKGPPEGRGADLEGTGCGQDALLTGEPKRLLDELAVGQELLGPAQGLQRPAKRLPVPGAVQDAGAYAQVPCCSYRSELAGQFKGGDGELRITGEVAQTRLVFYPTELPQGTGDQIGGDVGAQRPPSRSGPRP